jgi:hypothetical protein
MERMRQQTHQPNLPTLRLTFAERTAFPQPVEAPRVAQLVHSQELVEVELTQWALPDSYRLLVWVPVTATLRVDSVITLGGVEWVVRAITPRDRRGLSPGPAGDSTAHKLRLADTPGV